MVQRHTEEGGWAPGGGAAAWGAGSWDLAGPAGRREALQLRTASTPLREGDPVTWAQQRDIHASSQF